MKEPSGIPSVTIKNFAEQYRLKIRCDECGDSIIPGKRGHLYFDGDSLCLMVTDSRPANWSKWVELGAKKLWMGDISDGVQDVKVTDIPLENARLAIRMAGAKPKRIMSEAQHAVLEKARTANPIFSRGPHAPEQQQRVERLATREEGWGLPGGQPPRK